METDRRTFIKKSLSWLLSLVGLGYLLSSVRMLIPPQARLQALTFVALMPEDGLPRRGVRKKELVYSVAGKERRGRVFVVVSGNGMTVLSAVCSHLGCLVNYSKVKREFICPCHGGRYDLAGRNIAGPPPAPLAELPHRIENGMVLVGVKV